MSTLRESIQEIICGIDLGHPEPVINNLNEITNALLDAIDASLPKYEGDEAYYTKYPVLWKPIDTPQANAADAGYYEAIERVRAMLLAAKEQPNE